MDSSGGWRMAGVGRRWTGIGREVDGPSARPDRSEEARRCSSTRTKPRTPRRRPMSSSRSSDSRRSRSSASPSSWKRSMTSAPVSVSVSTTWRRSWTVVSRRPAPSRQAVDRAAHGRQADAQAAPPARTSGSRIGRTMCSALACCIVMSRRQELRQCGPPRSARAAAGTGSMRSRTMAVGGSAGSRPTRARALVRSGRILRMVRTIQYYRDRPLTAMPPAL